MEKPIIHTTRIINAAGKISKEKDNSYTVDGNGIVTNLSPLRYSPGSTFTINVEMAPTLYKASCFQPDELFLQKATEPTN